MDLVTRRHITLMLTLCWFCTVPAAASQTPNDSKLLELPSKWVRQIQKLTASDATNGDLFGISVAISGDTAVVAAGSNDDAGTTSGSVYIFERDFGGADNWGEIKKLTASDAAGFDEFGNDLSINGDTIVVGAFLNDDTAENSGSVYVFERNLGGADNWGEVRKINASDAAMDDEFGTSVSISGDLIVVGAMMDDDAGMESGSAYIFERNFGGGDNWGEVKKLTASDAAALANFGRSASISGDTVVIGADKDESVGINSGSAYVFERDLGGADNWGEVKKLTASDAAVGDLFGRSVSISDDSLVIAARGGDDAGSNSGSAYVFERDLGGADNWGEAKKLTASDGAASDAFGVSVSISGDALVVGAFQDDDAGAESGSAYIFERNLGGTNNWGEARKLIASDGAASDAFANVVSISQNTVIVGALFDDDAGSASGSAYIFEGRIFADGFESGTTSAWSSVTRR